MSQPIILWFRRDFRLHDHLALEKALQRQAPIIPLFIFDDGILQSERIGAPRLKFMLAALTSLDESLQKLNTRLLIQHGDPFEILRNLAQKVDAQTLFFNRDYTPFARDRDKHIAENLDIEMVTCHDMLLQPPTSVLKDDGDPYVVFTPFKRKWLENTFTYNPHREPTNDDFYAGDDLNYKPIPMLSDLGFEDTIDIFEASELAAQAKLSTFIDENIFGYEDGRNEVFHDPLNHREGGTSYLSSYLRFGIISPRQCYQAAIDARHQAKNETQQESIDMWISELGWRDFYTHILYFFPRVYTQNFREKYDAVQWRENQDELDRWKNGMTGFPIVDAAMRQLKEIGWMHNRSRMIVSSFLTKDLLMDWRVGELHFMQWLLDGDLAANNGGWQWAAGTGTDAQPYFRIFNPISQSKKHDPNGEYIRRWVPELRDVDTKKIHEPWKLDSLPNGYPKRMVDHQEARQRTLDEFKRATSD